MEPGQLPASFRDPSGFVFHHNGDLYRQINKGYAEDYELLISSGLYEELARKKFLVEHREVDARDIPEVPGRDRYTVIRPEVIPYVSYPYEWSFSQLKDAAILTLSIQEQALRHGMTLKDASAYNVQFIGSRPVFIDTLSFERYVEGAPWVAYRQFCQHFLGPLSVMASCDVRLRHLLRSFIDGLPLDLVSRLLPRRTWLKYSLLSHIHLHAVSQRRYQDNSRDEGAGRKTASLSRAMQLALVASLTKAVDKCRLPTFETQWGDYYTDTNYSSDSMSAKEKLVVAMVNKYVSASETIQDIGGNTGRFSRLVASPGRQVISHDIDELAIERNYLLNKQNGIENVLPLVLDLANPSPGLGWAHEERDSLLDRAEGCAVLALALIHHLVIANNVPMAEVASLFHRLAGKLIIEFVPKEDSQVKRLLASREDIFPHYDIVHFEQSFAQFFTILDKQEIEGTQRTLFAMRRR